MCYQILRFECREVRFVHESGIALLIIPTIFAKFHFGCLLHSHIQNRFENVFNRRDFRRRSIRFEEVVHSVEILFDFVMLLFGKCREHFYRFFEGLLFCEIDVADAKRFGKSRKQDYIQKVSLVDVKVRRGQSLRYRVLLLVALSVDISGFKQIVCDKVVGLSAFFDESECFCNRRLVGFDEKIVFAVCVRLSLFGFFCVSHGLFGNFFRIVFATCDKQMIKARFLSVEQRFSVLLAIFERSEFSCVFFAIVFAGSDVDDVRFILEFAVDFGNLND